MYFFIIYIFILLSLEEALMCRAMTWILARLKHSGSKVPVVELLFCFLILWTPPIGDKQRKKFHSRTLQREEGADGTPDLVIKFAVISALSTAWRVIRPAYLAHLVQLYMSIFCNPLRLAISKENIVIITVRERIFCDELEQTKFSGNLSSTSYFIHLQHIFSLWF